MEALDIHVQERAISGKSAVRNLKNSGLIPGVLYGIGGSIPISLQLGEIKEILGRHGENALLNINFQGRQIQGRMQEVQRDPLNQEIIHHIDLMPITHTGAADYLH